jgi:hypothetical protein
MDKFRRIMVNRFCQASLLNNFILYNKYKKSLSIDLQYVLWTEINYNFKGNLVQLKDDILKMDEDFSLL